MPVPVIFYRTGRKVGRTIYRVVGPEPSDEDELIGLMDSAQLARMFVDAMNTACSKWEKEVRARRRKK